MFVTVVGGSISALTTTLVLLGPGGLLLLLLLLGEFWISLLALYSAKLVRLVTTACSRALRALFECQGGRYANLVRFQSLDVRQLGLVDKLSYNLHGRRELGDQNHRLHGERNLEPSFFEVGKISGAQT